MVSSRALWAVAIGAIVLIASFSGLANPDLHLEADMIWGENVTYAYSVIVTDIDGDGIDEIITGGSSISEGRQYAEIAISQYIAGNLAIHTQHMWEHGEGGTSVESAYVADVDEDGTNEIISAGYTTVGGDVHCDLAIWVWNPPQHALALEMEIYEFRFTRYNSVYVADLDGLHLLEIIVAGEDTAPQKALLAILNWDNNQVDFRDQFTWPDADLDAAAYGVYAEDVVGDGTLPIEIVVAGYQQHPVTLYKQAQLAIFQFDGVQIIPRLFYEWLPGMPGDFDEAEALSIYADDVGDGVDVEIVTCGYARPVICGTSGDLELFRWDGNSLTMPGDYQWPPPGQNDRTKCQGVYVEEIDGAPPRNILTTGSKHPPVGLEGELIMWTRHGGNNFDQEIARWAGGDHYAVYAKDIDIDPAIEILSAGHYRQHHPERSWAELRIYYWAL